jgi:hypothetical protein
MQILKNTTALTLTLISSISLASGPNRINAGDVFNDQAIQAAMGSSSIAEQQAALAAIKVQQYEQPGLPAAPGGPRESNITHSGYSYYLQNGEKVLFGSARDKQLRREENAVRGKINSRDVIDQEAIRNGRNAEDVIRDDAQAHAQNKRDNQKRQRELEECHNLALLVSTLRIDLSTEEHKLAYLRGSDAIRTMSEINSLKRDLKNAENQWKKCSAKLSR